MGTANPAGSGEAKELVLRAPAKVNLALRILEREESGYHQLETLFSSLEFCDILRIAPVPGEVSLGYEGPELGPWKENLIHLAARAFQAEAGKECGAHIILEKRIPVRGGLGGGSSDAGATLRGLSQLYPGRVGADQLIQMAGRLGADVPFFLSPSPLALAWGRGDRILPLPPVPAAPVLLAVPPVDVSTPEAFSLLAQHRRGARAPDAARILSPEWFADWEGIAAFAQNDFEDVVLPAVPVLHQLLEALRASGPRFAHLSGSGSTVFAVYQWQHEAEAASEALDREFSDVRFHLTRTLESVPDPSRGGGVEPVA